MHGSERPRLARADVQRVNGSLQVRADMPGIKPDDVHVTVEDGMLTIKGDDRHEAEEKERGFLRRERYTGSYLRTISLPDHVDLDGIEATVTDGVVEVTIPMHSGPEHRRIEIQPKPV